MAGQPGRFSFEFSPPRNDDAVAKLAKVHDRLAELEPGFFSVTYGAGGSTRQGTRQTVLDIHAAGSNVAPHMSFGADSSEAIAQLLCEYRDAGIKRIVALRGDVPSGLGGGGMRYADELVGFIRDTTGDHFHIEVAAYPEVHPDSPGLPSEIHYFKQKVEAGADSAITQYFYVAEAYFNFVEACAKAGVDVPIVPGVMPITNYASLLRFSDKCQAEVPRWLRKKLEAYDDGSEDLRRAGEEVVTELCRRLLDWGAPGLHFYTINQSLPTRRIWRNLFD